MRHEKKMGGAGTGNPEHRPETKIADGLTHSSNGGTTVPCAADTLQEELPLRRHPAAYGSVWTPTRHRRWWTVIYRCPHCGEHHHGRSPRRIASGVRHARCGRLIWLVIQRVYGEAAYV